MHRILFVFAHQDDEYPIISRIRYEILKGSEVICLYLTSGNGYNISPIIRNNESLDVLLRVGVKRKNVFFLGSDNNIDDGKLTDNIEAAYCLSFQNAKKINGIFCIAWEGGHPDHDAAHLIALALAKNMKILDKTFQYPMYNKLGAPSHLFRVIAPLKENGKPIIRKIKQREAFANSLKCLNYKTQWRTWLGLFPEAFLKIAILRLEIIQPVAIERTKERPHQKKLLYEKKFKIRFEEFMKYTKDFRYKYLYR